MVSSRSHAPRGNAGGRYGVPACVCRVQIRYAVHRFGTPHIEPVGEIQGLCVAYRVHRRRTASMRRVQHLCAAYDICGLLFLSWGSLFHHFVLDNTGKQVAKKQNRASIWHTDMDVTSMDWAQSARLHSHAERGSEHSHPSFPGSAVPGLIPPSSNRTILPQLSQRTLPRAWICHTTSTSSPRTP